MMNDACLSVTSLRIILLRIILQFRQRKWCGALALQLVRLQEPALKVDVLQIRQRIRKLVYITKSRNNCGEPTYIHLSLNQIAHLETLDNRPQKTLIHSRSTSLLLEIHVPQNRLVFWRQRQCLPNRRRVSQHVENIRPDPFQTAVLQSQ